MSFNFVSKSSVSYHSPGGMLFCSAPCWWKTQIKFIHRILEEHTHTHTQAFQRELCSWGFTDINRYMNIHVTYEAAGGFGSKGLLLIQEFISYRFLMQSTSCDGFVQILRWKLMTQWVRNQCGIMNMHFICRIETWCHVMRQEHLAQVWGCFGSNFDAWPRGLGCPYHFLFFCCGESQEWKCYFS